MLACRGGWSDSLNVRNDKSKLPIAKDYLNKVCEEDISRVDDVQRNAELARLILRSYTRNLCALAKKISHAGGCESRDGNDRTGYIR